MKDKENSKEKESLINKILKRKKLLVVLFIILAIGFFVYRGVASKNGKNGSQSTEVKRGEVREELILSGKIDADEYVALSYPVSGKVSWVGVKEGDKVKKGQALGKLDTTSLNAAYQQALSALRAADATVENIHNQVKDHSGDETFVQKDTRTTAEVTKDRAYEAVKIAEDNLKNATLHSPFEGVVTSVTAPFSGINVIYAQTQFEVINPQTMYFNVSADQTEVINIKVGQTVRIVIDSYPNDTYDGIVTFVSYTPRIGDTGTAYKVKIKFADSLNTDIEKFRIGLGGDAKFITSKVSDVLYLPPKYVKTDSKGKYVKLDRKKSKVYVETGLEGEDAIEIKSGVNEGQTVFD